MTHAGSGGLLRGYNEMAGEIVEYDNKSREISHHCLAKSTLTII